MEALTRHYAGLTGLSPAPGPARTREVFMEPTQAAAQLRQDIRKGLHRGPTSGLAPGYVQCNIAILPRDWAGDFLRFCQANPRPCPVVAVAASLLPAPPAQPVLAPPVLASCR